MAFFLRDEALVNHTVDRESLIQICRVFQARLLTIPIDEPSTDGSPDAYLTFTIRFDNKGHRVFDLDDLLRYFDQAAHVERIIFSLESKLSLGRSRAMGAYLELKLLKDAPSYLVASADDESWVDTSHLLVMEAVQRFRNRNALARNPFTLLTIQLVGIFVGFLLSAWGAKVIAPSLAVDNSFLIVFLLLMLVFSNLWTLVNQKLVELVDYAFPALRFYRPRKDQASWLLQALIGGIVVAVVLFLIGQVFSYLASELGSILLTGT